MADTKIAVTGIYPTQASLESGILALRKAGLRPSDISVLHFQSPEVQVRERLNAAKPDEGSSTGVTAETAAIGPLAGIRSITIPGMGVFVAAGPIVSAIADAIAMGAVDGLAYGLVTLGLTVSDAGNFRDRVINGGILISVHSDNGYWAKRAREVMERTGARNVSITEKEDRNLGMSGQPVSCLAQE